jgi:acetyltransferase-like isoleucine patch superfamily enzyme
MLAPSTLSPRRRAFFAGLIHRATEWVTAVGTISPDDRRARAFRHLGRASCISYPPGPILGEALISIGDETLIGPGVALAVGMMGEQLDLSREAVIAIGDRCNIGRNSSIVARSSIIIEDDVTTGPNVYITDHNHTYANLDMPISRQWPTSDPVRIGAGSWLGAGVTVLPGAAIGRNVVVAAGAVVRGVVPDHSVVAAGGGPAVVVRRYVDGEGWVPPLREQTDNEQPPLGWPTT